MTVFKTLALEALPNDAHCGFFGDATKKLASAGSDVKNAVKPLDAELDRLYAMEADNMYWLRKSELTAAIAAANRRLDRAVVGFSKQVASARHSFLPAVADAAKKIYNMLRNYGYVVNKSYDREIADVEAILRHLNGDFAADAQTAGVAVWIPEITAACAELAGFIGERDRKSLDKPALNFRETRGAVDRVWRQIVKIVNGGAALHFSGDFDAFINSLNPEIERFNNEYHRVRINIAACEPEPLPQQPYTGYACTPVPEVFIATPNGCVRLELGKDFTVAYKNNVNAGIATCIIRGIGAYKGKKMITFFIKE
jgi:hypothetical protein